jgi:hypothetical protein
MKQQRIHRARRNSCRPFRISDDVRLRRMLDRMQRRILRAARRRQYIPAGRTAEGVVPSDKHGIPTFEPRTPGVQDLVEDSESTAAKEPAFVVTYPSSVQ